jgi:hypothetical protein
VSWNVSLQGEFHQIVKGLRNLTIQGDQRAIEFGHDKIAIEMALCAVDKAPTGSLFVVSLSGHSTDRRTFSVSANVTATEAK